MEGKQVDKRDRLGKYELLERLGQGGMGEVWKARDTQLQRYVAIKLLRTDLRDDPDFVAYFTREARLVAALRHPNIVQIHDFQLAAQAGENGYAYMVMDYIEGGTLADAIRGTVRKGVFWSASDIVDLFTSISLALDYAHGQKMIHRDIKPANILLDRSLATGHMLGEPVLTDFGIARWQGGGSTVTGFVGTPLYISPEQAHNRPVSARSDLYSLGIILYEVLTGITPFRGDNPLAIMLQHVEDEPPLPSLINPRVSPALSAVVLQSIAKDPQERFPSARAMTKALARAFHLPVPALLEGSGESLSHYNPLQPLRESPGMTPVPASFAPSTPPLNFAPPAGSNLESFAPPAKEINRMTPIAGEVTRITPTRNFSSREQAPAQAPNIPGQLTANESQLQPMQRPHRQAGVLSGRWLVIGCVACGVLLLLGVGIFAVGPRFFRSPGAITPLASNGVVGHILFRSNASTARGVFDELQIDLNNVLPAPAGQVYYAWLMQANSEASTIPHWPLQINNGIIHDLYTSSLPQTDLFAMSDLFLITIEANNNTPVVPYPSPAAHVYYALITHVSSINPTFAVIHCPTSNINSATNPCR